GRFVQRDDAGTKARDAFRELREVRDLNAAVGPASVVEGDAAAVLAGGRTGQELKDLAGCAVAEERDVEVHIVLPAQDERQPPRARRAADRTSSRACRGCPASSWGCARSRRIRDSPRRCRSALGPSSSRRW